MALTRTHHVDRTIVVAATEQTPMITAGRAISLVLGVGMVVVGIVALVRTGIPSDLDLTGAHATVGWLHHTPLLALVHLAVGAAIIPAGRHPWFDNGATTAGLVAIVAGIVLWIEPDAFHGMFGMHAVHGMTYLALGGLLLLSGWLTAPRVRRTRSLTT